MNLVDNLTEHEQKAALEIMNVLEANNGSCIAITSKIADALNITRSIVVQAITKLQIAEIIDSRSLGMKGTKMKVTDKEEFIKVKEVLEEEVCTNPWL